jgi:hypothetical protein
MLFRVAGCVLQVAGCELCVASCENAVFVQAISSKLKAQSLWILSILLVDCASCELRVACCGAQSAGSSDFRIPTSDFHYLTSEYSDYDYLQKTFTPI